MSKLSSPTVHRGPSHRPPSVASSRSGCSTPSTFGRSSSTSYPVTPSAGRKVPLAGGRVTPSPTCVTPIITPSRPRTSSHVNASHGKIIDTVTTTFTAGSRASKYVTMTARQLNSRNTGGDTILAGKGSMTGMAIRPGPSPARVYSPNYPSASPLRTPKPASNGRVSNGLEESSTAPSGRPALNTPRARIPSAISMPPPPPPIATTTSPPVSSDNLLLEIDHELRLEITGDHSKSSHMNRSDCTTSLDDLAVAVEPSAIDHAHTTIDNLDCEHETTNSTQQQIMESRISHLEAQLKTCNTSLVERDHIVESLRRSLLDLEAQKGERERQLKDAEWQLGESVASAKALKETLELKETRESERDCILKGKNTKLLLLEAEVKKLSAQFDGEKMELASQVEELRRAGQVRVQPTLSICLMSLMDRKETIALYEERLNEADSNRFELENRIASLQAQVLRTNGPDSSDSESRSVSAAQIDNDSLRDQVHHLQMRISTLEDTLEEVHGTSEREAVLLREKVRRFKEKEEVMKKELDEGRKEVDQMIRSEAAARVRVQEIEEALRENAIALENARAEVEGLRAQLAVSNGNRDLSKPDATFSLEY